MGQKCLTNIDKWKIPRINLFIRLCEPRVIWRVKRRWLWRLWIFQTLAFPSRSCKWFNFLRFGSPVVWGAIQSTVSQQINSLYFEGVRPIEQKWVLMKTPRYHWHRFGWLNIGQLAPCWKQRSSFWLLITQWWRKWIAKWKTRCRSWYIFRMDMGARSDNL